MGIKFPSWLETFIIAAVHRYITPEQCKQAWAEVKAGVLAQMAEAAKGTAPDWDDALVAKVTEALNGCDAGAGPDLLCELIKGGEASLVKMLRAQAAKTETALDDAACDLIAAAFGV